MAKIRSGILGPVSGSIGGIVGAKWKGIPTIRSKPLSVANPNTASQQAQRGKFSQVVAVARLLLSDLIQTYWDPFAREMSGYNSFVRQNIAAFDAAGLATPANFYSARGILVGVANIDVGLHVSGDYAILTFDDNSGIGDALPDDVLHVVCYNTVKKSWTFSLDNALRSAGVLNVNNIDWETGDFIKFYPFFTRPNVSKISDSVHVELEIDI